MKKPLPVNGRFSVDRNNRLAYWLNEPASWGKRYDMPPKVAFTGRWGLNKNYDLELHLLRRENQFEGDRLTLRGDLLSVDNDSLVFELKSYDRRGLLHIQLLKLSGFWQANAYNRIGFMVQRASATDALILGASWQVNKNQQISCAYKKTDLKTKTRTVRALTFEGFWQIGGAKRLTYILSHGERSHFDFRCQIETPNLYPQKNVIKYRLGTGVSAKAVSLYGAWKFDRNLGLVFQMDYGRGKRRRMEFGANARVNEKDEIVFSLVNKTNEPLGATVTYTFHFLNKTDAALFLRLKKAQKEARVEAGLRFPF